MASTTPKPQKRLLDFLNEQQEPFNLEAFLSEREHSKRWSSSDEDSANTSKNSSTFGLSKKKKAPLLAFCKVLKALCNKLAFHKESKIVQKHASVPEPDWVDNIVQFSSASTSTMLNSGSNIDEVGSSISSYRDQHVFNSHNLCNVGLQRQQQRCIQGSHESLGNIPLRRVPNVHERLRRFTEDSLLSAAIWSSLLGQQMEGSNCSGELRELLPRTNDVSKILKSKRALHRIKNMLLFDCVKDITITLPTEYDRKRGYKQFMGPLEHKKLIRRRTKKWGQRDGTNLSYLLTLDYLDSVREWSEIEPHVGEICVDVSDAILENIKSEIVEEMIEAHRF